MLNRPFSTDLSPILDAVGAAVAVFDVVDAGFAYATTNQLYLQWLGLSEDEVIGRSPADVLPRYLADVLTTHLQTCARSGTPIKFESVLNQRTEVRWWLNVGLPLLSEGRVIRVFLTAVDITEKKEIELAFQENRDRLNAIVDSAHDAIITINREHRITFVNGAAERMFLYSADELIGKPLELLLPERYRELHPSYVETFARSPVMSREMHRRAEVGGRRRNGEEFRAQIAISKIQVGTTHEMTAIVRDVSEMARLISELKTSATTDFLTGLPNRRSLMHTIEEEFERARRYGRPLSLLMLDIDHFKSINDNYGHLVGDETLRMFADVLQRSARKSDRIGRLGGEEFAMLLPETGLTDAVRAGDRVRELAAITEVRDATGQPFRFTLSVGVAEIGGTVTTPEQLLHEADLALYEAKRGGRNCVRAAGRGSLPAKLG